MKNDDKVQTEYNFESKLLKKSEQSKILLNTNYNNLNQNINIQNTLNQIKLKIDIESQNHKFKDQIIISPSGLEGSLRINNENENSVFFGCELYSNQVSYYSI